MTGWILSSPIRRSGAGRKAALKATFPGSPEELLALLEADEVRVAALRAQLQAILAEALLR